MNRRSSSAADRPGRSTSSSVCKRLLSILVVSALLAFPSLGAAEESQESPASSAVPAEDTSTRELLVRLAPEPAGPPPARVVHAIHHGRLPPGPFTNGQPVAARFLIRQRLSGAALEALRQTPERPRARLERWVVLTYPEGVDLTAMQRILTADPGIEIVERNVRGNYSAVTPNDPHYPLQWGIPALALPDAWERTKGHGFVGLIDTGLDVDHEDLVPFDPGTNRYAGGNFRPHLSWDFSNPATCITNPGGCVDEAEPGDATNRNTQGHGTHVSGIVGATADNGTGVTGNCWGCSLLMARSQLITTAEVAEALHWLADRGAQTISMSFGWTNAQTAVADAIDLLNERDLILTAAAGNYLVDLFFPAFDPDVLGVGGTQPPQVPGTVEFWEEDICPFPPSTRECGSNYTVTPGGPMQELVAPAADVLSTFYVGGDWNPTVGCHDGSFPPVGYGYCTGTSMSSPMVASVATLVRSINPLASQQDVRSILRDTASGGGTWDPELGYGVPDAAAAVDTMLGVAAGQVLANRLTPLFVQFSPDAEAHLETTVPQRAAAAMLDPDTPYFTYPGLAPHVAWYDEFPGTSCTISCGRDPLAWVYLFTTDREPFTGSPELVPLYRLSFDEAYGGNPENQSFAYTTEVAGIEFFAGLGYNLDGIEGYLYERCSPEPSCIPPGATRLYRLFNPDRDDYVVIPESEVAGFQSRGYIFQSSLNDWIGYVYENVDTDGDRLIDGFEVLIGSDPAAADSDGDGLGDGDEVLVYPYSDPLDVPECTPIFSDGFDSGDFDQWSGPIVIGSPTLEVTSAAAMEGPFGMEARIRSVGDRAFVIDRSPVAESTYRARFLYRFDAQMSDGRNHVLWFARHHASPTRAAAMMRMRKRDGEFQLAAFARRDDLSWAWTPWLPIASKSESISVELLWRAGETAGFPDRGSLELTVDQQTVSLAGIDNDTFRVDEVLLGVVNGVDPGTSGLFQFDAFESCSD